MNRLPYKKPTIVRGKKYWHVAYFYEHPDKPGKFKKFQVKDGINYVKDLDQREIEVQKLKRDIELALQNGFNPFLPEIRVESQFFAEETAIEIEEEMGRVELWTMEEVQSKFLNHCRKRGLSPNTIKKYESNIRTIIKWFEENDLLELEASKVNEDHINDFLDEYFEEYKWSNRTYNNYLNFCNTFFSRLERLERRKNRKAKYDIDFTFLEEKYNRAERNKYYTPQVAELVKKEVKKDKELHRYIRWIFYSCMRPKEIHSMQIKDIDTISRQIKVNGKTGYRLVPICEELLELINEMDLLSKPMDYYVFGKGEKTSNEKVFEDYFRRKFRPIKVTLNLDQNYTLYSWKHTRVVSLITAGFDDNQVMTLTGHRDRAGFEAYKRDLVIDNSVMKGKTIEF